MRAKGPILGIKDGKIVRYNGDGHLLTVAKNGSGKDVSSVLVNAIKHTGSLVVIDPKGGVTRKTARYRAEVLGQDVYVFDPFHVVPDEFIPPRRPVEKVDEDGVVTGEQPTLRARYNPLSMVAKSDMPVALAKMQGAAIVIPDPGKPHWGQGGRSALAAYASYAALDPEYPLPRHYGSVWDDLNLPTSKTVRDDGEILPSFFDIHLREMSRSQVAGGYPAREANRFIGGASDEMKSIRQTIFTNAGAIFDDPQIIEAMSYSDLEFGTIQHKPTTIYLVLPGFLSDSHARWFRLMLACILGAVEREPVWEHDDQRPRTLWLLNEFASLGRNDVLLEALPRMREYGCQYWVFVQDLNQLRYHYKDAWETFVSNCGVIQNFGGSADVFTAEYLSKMAGQTTAVVKNFTENTNVTAGVGTSYTRTLRPLVYPHEIATLNATPEDALKQMLIFTGVGPTFADRVLYYRDLPDYQAWERQ